MSHWDDTQYGIGSSITTVVTLRRLGIPVPDQCIYSPASVYNVRGDGSRVGDGVATLQWIWDTISIAAIAVLMSFLGSADYAPVYVHTDKRDGNYATAAAAFATFFAIMWRPVLSGQEGTPVPQSPRAVQSLKVQFVRLVEVGDYL